MFVLILEWVIVLVLVLVVIHVVVVGGVGTCGAVVMFTILPHLRPQLLIITSTNTGSTDISYETAAGQVYQR